MAIHPSYCTSEMEKLSKFKFARRVKSIREVTEVLQSITKLDYNFNF